MSTAPTDYRVVTKLCRPRDNLYLLPYAAGWLTNSFRYGDASIFVGNLSHAGGQCFEHLAVDSLVAVLGHFTECGQRLRGLTHYDRVFSDEQFDEQWDDAQRSDGRLHLHACYHVQQQAECLDLDKVYLQFNFSYTVLILTAVFKSIS